MFICEFCSKPCGPKISPNMVSLESELRKVDYRGWNDEGHLVIVSSGIEIMAEHKQCPSCSGIAIRSVPTYDYTGYRAVTSGMWSHAGKCRHMLAECSRCLANVEAFSAFPLPALNYALAEVSKATRLRTSLASLVVDGMIARTLDETKRAKADFAASFPILKEYEGRGGGL